MRTTLADRSEAVIWPLIYIGLALCAWGIAVWRQGGDADTGPWMVAVGTVCVVVGAALVVRRASRGDGAAPAPSSTGDGPR